MHDGDIILNETIEILADIETRNEILSSHLKIGYLVWDKRDDMQLLVFGYRVI